MPRIRIDLSPQSFEALARQAAADRRPVDSQAEVLLERALGVRAPERSTPDYQDNEVPVLEVANAAAA